MAHEHLPQHSLLFAIDGLGTAMAIILQGHVITANHIVEGNPLFQTVDCEEDARLELCRVATRDLAISPDCMRAIGFEKTAPPEVGALLTIVGFHGPSHDPFEIFVKIREVLPNGRVIVERIRGREAQVGMSGSPAVTEHGEVVGILVESVDGTDGQQLYLETVDGIDQNLWYPTSV